MKKKQAQKSSVDKVDLQLETPLDTKEIKEIAEIIFYDHITSDKDILRFFLHRYGLKESEVKDLLKIRKNIIKESTER